MNWNKLVRQFHRWVSLAFVASVVVTTVAMMQKEPIVWMSYVPLLPLALLAISGLYMFFLPYLGRSSRGQEPAQ